MAMLRVRCAWCEAVLAEGDPGEETTDGICPACYAQFVVDSGMLSEIARRVVRAYVKANPADFARALGEMRAAVGGHNGR